MKELRRIDSDAALADPEFETSVNPITTRGADYAHLITASPPGFENPAASLIENPAASLIEDLEIKETEYNDFRIVYMEVLDLFNNATDSYFDTLHNIKTTHIQNLKEGNSTLAINYVEKKLYDAKSKIPNSLLGNTFHSVILGLIDVLKNIRLVWENQATFGSENVVTFEYDKLEKRKEIAELLRNEEFQQLESLLTNSENTLIEVIKAIEPGIILLVK